MCHQAKKPTKGAKKIKSEKKINLLIYIKNKHLFKINRKFLFEFF